MTKRILAPLFLLVAGCSPEQSATPTPSGAPVAVTTPAAPATSPEPALSGGPMAGATDPYAPLSKTPELDAAIAAAEKGKDMKALAEAYAARGLFRMRDDDKAGQRVKYRAALSDFRKALKADPKNTQAALGKNEIESIYTGMGRPIPSEAEADAVSRTGTYKP